MGTKQKKDKKGTAVRYISRAQALKKLQLSLADFRRLCILKGIYPRTPKKKLHGNTTYYYTKDIQFLAHEPLLHRFRDIKAHLKHVRRRSARREWFEVSRLRANTPEYTLDHLVRERYPTFTDALADLDDALSCIHLFAAAAGNDAVPQRIVDNCARLAREWQFYAVRSGALKRSFISVKGVYYGATVQGIDITWMAPHRFAVPESDNADYRVLATFLEFYQTLLGFVLFRLYTTELAAAYPPGLDAAADAGGAWIGALVPTAKQGAEDTQTATGAALLSAGMPGRVFSNMSFFVNREVPARHVELALLAGGASCVVETPETTARAADDVFTHHVVDRPMAAARRVPGRVYVQPQWVFDSLNAGVPLPTDPYAPGTSLPPHLSPFVKYSDAAPGDEGYDHRAETYIPERAKEIQRIVEAHNAAASSGAVPGAADVSAPSAAELSVAAARAKLMAAGGRAALAEAGELEDTLVAARAALYAAEVAAEVAGRGEDEPSSVIDDEDDFLGVTDAPVAAAEPEESESGALPAPVTELAVADEDVALSDEAAETEDHAMRRTMMRRKDAKTYKMMQKSLTARRTRTRTLEKKASAAAKARKAN